jgi:adenylate cyclase
MLVGAQLAFNAGVIVDVAYPILAVALSAVGSIGSDYLTVTRDRLRMRQAFGRFVPDSVVEEVMRATGDESGLPGVTLEATVMFADLRGFTTFAEAHPASTVIDVLNRYLDEMTEAILASGGTIVSYLGDGVMAVFGAPLAQGDHADRALDAARDMLGERLDSFNAWLRDRGLEQRFELGIGLSTGPVRSGTVGGGKRLEYATVGDTTNVAARLQAHTKGTRYRLLMTEATREELRRPADDLVFAGSTRLRGRRTETRMWALAPTRAGAR